MRDIHNRVQKYSYPRSSPNESSVILAERSPKNIVPYRRNASAKRVVSTVGDDNRVRTISPNSS